MSQSVFKLFLTNRLAALAGADSLRAIREGLLWLLPCLLVSAAFLVLSVCARLLGAPDELVDFLAGLHEKISGTLPLLVAASIGYMLAIRYRLPQVPVAFLCLTHVVIAIYLLQDYPRAAATLVLFIAIASPLVNVPIIARLYRQPWLRLVRENVVGYNVRDSINVVIPGLLTAAMLVMVLSLLLEIPSVAQMQVPFDLTALDHPYAYGLLISATNSMLWFFGIHGAHAMQPLFDVLDLAVTVNQLNVAAAEPARYALNSGLLGCFAFTGGSGASLSLIIAILLFSRDRSLRLLALAATPLSLFNVNEILLFGLPIILNPRLFLPFLIAPMLNTVLAVAAVQAGWVAPVVTGMPLTSPVLLNAYLSTNGDWAAVVLQLVLVAVGCLVYAPYVIALHRQQDEEQNIYIRSFDTTFRSLEEKGRLFELDPVVAAHRNEARRTEELERIRLISEYEFHLEFQPQISKVNGLCIGCEALMRARDKDGRAQQPWEFLRWLAQANLMADVDLWVASQALEQYRRWQKIGFELPMTINVTAATLSTPEHGERLLEILAQAHGRISVELTEDALVGDVQLIHRLIEGLHGFGAKLYIDDFGTGYSALSYLHQFRIDGIKIDRSFVVAHRHANGARVLSGMLRLCETLDLDIIVEGVETREQYDALQSSRELVIQGWYFSKAISATQMPAFVLQRQELAAGERLLILPNNA
ncbi:EAL domain-containing protein [Pseudomonas gingeri]